MRKLGQLMSAMIWQNIAVIITVGIIREVFGIYGWSYNARILLLVNPIYNTLVPLLLGYTGGKLIGGQRGAVVASIVIFGLTLASSAPVIFGAMIIGPLIGWIIQKCDDFVKKRVPVGYAFLVGNVLASLVAASMTIVCFLYVGQTLSAGIEWLTGILEHIIYSGWLPLTAIVIEPAKVFFLNNILNFGILGPLGIQQAKDLGKSILFLLESNPGPGLGVLLAYWIKTSGEKRKGALLAVFIHFFGGIHEVYFPYVLRKPLLLLAVVFGGMAGTIMFQMFDVGTVSMTSPGSIFLFIALSPKEDILYVLIGIFVSAMVSFFCVISILNPADLSPTEQENRERLQSLSKLETLEVINNDDDFGEKAPALRSKIVDTTDIQKIVFVCEAGLGSSSMGAAMLKKKLKLENLSLEVDNSAIGEIPEDADVIVCHQKLLDSVRKAAPQKTIFSLQSFTDMEGYDLLIEQLKK